MIKFWKYWDRYGVYIISAAVICLFGLLTPAIFTPDNIKNTLVTASMTAIAAAGMTLVIVTGGIDLSLGSILAMGSCITGIFVLNLRTHYLVAIIATLVSCTFIGMLNGIVVSKLRVLPFVATLATQVIIYGLAFLLTGGKYVFFLKTPEIKIITSARLLTVPLPIWYMFIVFAIVFVLYSNTTYGVQLRAVGSNTAAAKLSGINCDKILILTFMLSGLLAGAAGTLMAAQTMTGNPNYGSSTINDCITAVVMGGTSLKGGRGRVICTMIAAILIAFIRNGLNLLSITTHYQDIITAMILVFVLFIDGLKTKAMNSSGQVFIEYD